MSERLIDPEFLKKLRDKWSVDKRKPMTLEEYRAKRLAQTDKYTMINVGGLDLEVEVKPEPKTSLLERIRNFIINKLLPEGYVVIHKERTLQAALEEEKKRIQDYRSKLETDLTSAWNNLVENKREEEKLDLLKRKRSWARVPETMLLVLPVEETENSEQD